MGEEDPQGIIHLGYYDELKEKLLEAPTVFLLGPRYTGKTTGVEEARKVLGQLEHIDLQKHEEFQRAQDRVTKGGKGSAVIEGTAYRLAYALRIGGGQMDSEAYCKWLKEKDNEIDKVLKDKNTVIAELDNNDVEKLLDFFGAEKDKRRRELLVRLASYNGKVIIPLLKTVVEKHGGKSPEELEKMVDAEEKLISFIELMLLIEKESWMKIGERLINLLLDSLGLVDLGPMAGVPALARRVVTIFFGISNLRVSREGRLARILQLSDAWGRIPVEKRIRICEEIDEKFGLQPGSSFKFLEYWLGKPDEIDRTLTEDFIKKLEEKVEMDKEVKKKLDKINERLEELINEIGTVRRLLNRFIEFHSIYDRLTDCCEKVYPSFMHPPHTGEIQLSIFNGDWIGLGIDVVKNTIGDYPLVKSGKFEEYAGKVEKDLREGKVVIITGERGIGKSVLARYVLARFIREDDKLWVVTPKRIEPGQNPPKTLRDRVNKLGIKVILYYDPSLPEVYDGRGIPGSIDESDVKAVIEAFKLISRGKASVLLVIPGDSYERVQKVLKECEMDTSVVEVVNLDLRQDDFLRDIIKAYSGCEVIPDELVEGVREYSSYTLVAKLAGEWLREKCDKARVEVEAALRESKKNAKRFIARYIWEAIFQGKDELARREAILLLIRAHFGPIPRKFFEKPFTVRDHEPISQNIFDVIEHPRAFTTWLSTPKGDLIEEVLREIALGKGDQLGEEFKDFINAVREGRRIVRDISKSMGLSEEGCLLFLSSEYLFRMLQEELKRETVECLRRVIYILGSAISGHPFESSFAAFRELYGREELFKTAESCEVDDWLLVDGEVPLLVRLVLVKLLLDKLLLFSLSSMLATLQL
ncbi:MAG: hypothetical protein QXO02_05700 [Thermofilaceae archaeon]